MSEQKKLHRKNRIEHVRQRAWQRVGLNLSAKECELIAERIFREEARLIARISFNLSIWEVETSSGYNIIVIYDKQTASPVTVLTEKMLKENNYRVLYTGMKDKPMHASLSSDPKVMSELAKLKKE